MIKNSAVFNILKGKRAGASAGTKYQKITSAIIKIGHPFKNLLFISHI